MAFSFSNFNKERLFDFDTSKITGKYTSLEELFKENGPDKEYQLKAVYISKFSQFADEAPIAALADTYVNLPSHQLSDVKSMMNDANAVRAINTGYAGFTIRPYEKSITLKNGKVKKDTYYSAEWIDVDPSDYEEDEEE
ncbi:MAG: hypothetical protein J6T10_11160 [Methanobrevibacter sp.]|nr:hypothetical protein [Methanobrevibacter sp.]